MAPLPETLVALVRRSLQTLSPANPSQTLVARKKLPISHLKDPPFGVGSQNPSKLPNGVILGIIAAIAASLTLTAIWFFFRAKNGGFKFQEGDWDDYKSTVLRRKGPDGRTLTNATKSTKLGGGSIVHGQSWPPSEKYTTNKNKKNKKADRKNKGNSWDEKSAVSGSTGHTYDTGSYYDEPPNVAGLRGGGGSGYLSGRPKHGNARDADLAEYRHEKVARVGGLNRQHDGEHHDYSNTGSEVSTRPLVKKGKTESDKDRKKREKAERAALEKLRKDTAKRDKAAAKAAADAKKKAAKESKARSQAQAKLEKPGATTETRDFAQSPVTPKRAQPSAAYSFTAGDDETTHTTPTQEGSYYYPAYRPVAGQSPMSANNTPQSRYREGRSAEPRGARAQPSPSTGSPQKTRSRPPSDIPPSFPGSWGESSDVGTKVYSHHIPGLSKGTSEIDPHESVSQVGARRAAANAGGYRRGASSAVGGYGRRDSLSDSD